MAALGLSAGEKVRWRHGPAGRWQVGVVTRRERDGSVGVIDHRGSARSLAVERLEVVVSGPRGRPGWEPLVDRATRSEQLRLL